MEQKHTDEELLAAHRLARPHCSFNDHGRVQAAMANVRRGWDRHLHIDFAVLLLALGILPDGWVKASGWIYQLWKGGKVIGHCEPATGNVWFKDWPEAVRSGQAQIACLLIAAHVELERRRAQA